MLPGATFSRVSRASATAGEGRRNAWPDRVVTAATPRVSRLKQKGHPDAARKPAGVLSLNLFQLIYTESVSKPRITPIGFRAVYLGGSRTECSRLTQSQCRYELPQSQCRYRMTQSQYRYRMTQSQCRYRMTVSVGTN